MKNLKFYGVGGQGVVTATKVMSSAVSIHEDKYAITVPAYGHERRGAPVFSDIIMDEKPITLNCFVYNPDVVVVMDETVTEKHVNIGAGCSDQTILVLNTGSSEKAEELAEKFGFKKVYYADATQIAVDCIGRNIPNSPILGVLSKAGIVSIESVEKALIEFFGEKAGEKNAESARKAYEKTTKM